MVCPPNAAAPHRPRGVTMNEGLTRVVDTVEEWLCWRFQIQGKSEASYQRADAGMVWVFSFVTIVYGMSTWPC